MSDSYFPTKTVAVLGGGQLGTMLATAAQPLRVKVHCLDPSAEAPAAYNAQSFAEGEFSHARTVESFGRHADAVTIEIEAVSTTGLRALRDEHGVATRPSPEAIELIQDKGLQKSFYQEHHIPTAPFRLWEDASAIEEAVKDGKLAIPFVQKLRKGGYDGRGVQIVRSHEDLSQLLQGPSLTEGLAPYTLELAVVAARRPSGEVQTYAPVEMAFDPDENLVTKLVSPARIPHAVAEAARQLAERLIGDLEIEGLLAVEFFLLEDGSLWVNEVAPRPHNSGHITMNGFATSQFEQHLRAVLDLPLGSTEQYRPAVMINLLGEPGHTGPAAYQGFNEVLSIPGVHIHLYGKTSTRPHRKMGHVNIVRDDLSEALEVADDVRQLLKVVVHQA